MDYEKAYKRAKNMAELFAREGKVSYRFVETVFPELAESEDERTRKEIIAFIEQALHSGGGVSVSKEKENKWLAYLEKQKESLHISETCKENDKSFADESEDERIRKKCMDFIRKWPSKEDRDECLAWLEKQKEQNSKDKKCIDFTVYHPLKNGKGKYECIPYSFNGSLTSFSEDKDLIDFLRTCFYTKEECNEWIEKQKEQKPAWSEEDEYKLKQCIRIVTGWEADYDIVHSPYSNFLKSLRPQPQGVYKQIVHNIYAMLKDKDFMATNHHWMADLLNDIRVRCKNADECAKILQEPQWKPSEEQMGALNYAYCELFKRGDVGHNILGSLQKLIDQLREQM